MNKPLGPHRIVGVALVLGAAACGDGQPAGPGEDASGHGPGDGSAIDALSRGAGDAATGHGGAGSDAAAYDAAGAADGAGADADTPSDGAADLDGGGAGDAAASDEAAAVDAGGPDDGAPDTGEPDGKPDALAAPDGAADDAGPADATGAADAARRADGGDAATRDGAAADATAGDGGVASCGSRAGGPLGTTSMHLDVPVHDPSMIWDGRDYFLFATGGALSIRRSPNLLDWSYGGAIFASVPAWISAYLGTTPGSLWAPDISYFSGAFHVYYAGSTFGSNRSVIGLATTPTLQPSDAAYQWTDRGLVLSSSASDDYNAIDPSVAFDDTCSPWLAFGSFWSGIKLRRLDASTGMPASDDTSFYSLASRVASGNAIEAASIVSHNGYYYLFVSFDSCCSGVGSTYRTMMGRAPAITGPYVTRSGASMMSGAAEELLTTSGRYIGPGGGTAWRDGSTYLYVLHYYDGDDSGAPKLQIRPIVFGADDWVTLADPLFP